MAAASRSIVLYHAHDYGGVIRIPGSDLAIDVEVRGDNSGPHSVGEIHRIYAGLRRRFPNAEVTAANLAAIADAVEPHRGQLPVMTQEIGDTWIYGAASDPRKVARYLEVARLRSEWIRSGRLEAGGAGDLAFLAPFLLEVEHTWGTDTKTWLDFDHYTPHDLASMLDRPKYKVVLSSWQEKRQDLLDAIATLPAPLGAEAGRRIRALDAGRARCRRPAAACRRRTDRDPALRDCAGREDRARFAGCGTSTRGASGPPRASRSPCSPTRRWRRATTTASSRPT